jgi:hypothetical protein
LAASPGLGLTLNRALRPVGLDRVSGGGQVVALKGAERRFGAVANCVKIRVGGVSDGVRLSGKLRGQGIER